MLRILLVALLCWRAAVATGQSARVSFVEPVALFGYASGVAVEWEVYDDASVDYYVVLRRSRGLERAVATVPPRRNRDTPTIRYRHIDTQRPGPGTAFRLRAVFADQSFAQSDWLDADRAADARRRVLSALDDESLALLHISLASEGDHEVIVRIKTIGGDEMDSYPRALHDGDNVLEIDYRAWPSGYYTVEVGDEAASEEWLVHVDAEHERARTRRLPGAP